MLFQYRRTEHVSFVIFLVLLCCGKTFAQSPHIAAKRDAAKSISQLAIPKDDLVSRSMTLVAAITPDRLDARSTTVVQTYPVWGKGPIHLTTFFLKICEPAYNPNPAGKIDFPCVDPSVSTVFEWDYRSKEPDRITIVGRAITEKWFAFQREVVKSDPELTESAVTLELKKAGAKFGPDDKAQFLAALPMTELKRLLGPVELKSVEFHLRLSKGLEHNYVIVEWHVRLRARETGTMYQLCFEPFDGLLERLTREDEPTLAPQHSR